MNENYRFLDDNKMLYQKNKMIDQSLKMTEPNSSMDKQPMLRKVLVCSNRSAALARIILLLSIKKNLEKLPLMELVKITTKTLLCLRLT